MAATSVAVEMLKLLLLLLLLLEDAKSSESASSCVTEPRHGQPLFRPADITTAPPCLVVVVRSGSFSWRRIRAVTGRGCEKCCAGDGSG